MLNLGEGDEGMELKEDDDSTDDFGRGGFDLTRYERRDERGKLL